MSKGFARVLRRTKERVVSELPEKSEHTLYCKLEPVQRKVYWRKS